MQDNGDSQFLFKVLVVGDQVTGKKSLLKRFDQNVFEGNYYDDPFVPIHSLSLNILLSSLINQNKVRDKK